MRSTLKWTGRAAAVLAVIVLFLAWGTYYALRNTVPSVSGVATVAGLGAPASIVRDGDGVPHISAQSLADVHFALGFVHAQDRLWQMELQRRAAAGRLSELFGDRTLNSDIFMRTLDLQGAATRALANLPEKARDGLEAYARGVNAFMTRRRGLLEPRYPIEFLMLRHEPEPWTAVDSLLIVKLMALNLSTNAGLETLRLAFAAQGLTAAEMEDLLPADPAISPPPLPELASLYPVRKVVQAKQAAAMPLIDGLMAGGASNNWVVAGSRTKSGKPLLANDPHLRLSAPAIWYLAHTALLRTDGSRANTVGATLPGVPSIIVGRTDTLAWGFTNTGADVQDLFVEKINPANAGEYLTPEGWQPFERETVVIKVAGAADHTFERRKTRHGPVLPDFFRGIGAYLDAGHVAALSWTALLDDDSTAAAGLLLETTRTVDEFFGQMQAYVVPMQSMVVADNAGNIGLIAPGRVPVRDARNLVAGRAPVPGWDATYDWKGFIAFGDLPKVKNPPSGAIGTANARIVPPGFPHVLTNDWDAPFRQQRIETLVLDRTGHDIASMKAAQADVQSPAVARLQTLMISAAQAGAGVDDKVLDELTAWDGRQGMTGSEPLIFVAWMREAMRAIYADDLGPVFERYFDGRPQVLIRLLEGKATSRDWCDDRRTPTRETCGQVLADALGRALRELDTRFGPDRSQWSWGRIHVAFSEHRPFGLVPSLAPFFNIEVASPGGDETLNRGKMEYGDALQPFANRNASSYRAIYDLADLERSLYMQTTGQSGNPLSAQYRSFAERWARVEYIEIPTNPDVIARTAVGTWTLQPQR